MQQFQNYSMNNGYPQYGNQMYQPIQQYPSYYDRSIRQQQMPGTVQNIVSGKIVENVDIVRSMDIPIDGNVYFFPKADGTEIYTKQWLANGSTQVLTYKPYIEQESVVAESSSSNEKELNIVAFNAVAGEIMQKLTDIEKRIGLIEKPIAKTTASRTKKDGESE